MKQLKSGLILISAVAWSQTVDLAPVVARQVSRTAELSGELQPLQIVSLRAKVPGFVERVLVDRGSLVKEGQLLIELSAPEMAARIAEGEAKRQGAEADRLQAEAQLGAVQSNYDRLKKAAETPGAIAGNELIQAQKQVEAAEALVRSRQQAGHALEAALTVELQMQTYLHITAPFDGMVTERLIHPGALAGSGADSVLLTIQQISQLRLVVAVAEEYVGGIVQGAKVPFRVPAFPGRTWSGTVSRLSHVLDKTTRTMAVELDVHNADITLSPGMYATVKWPVRQSHPALFVPRTSVVTTTERTFVVRNQNGRADWVDVRKGAADGDLMEVIGTLKPGDLVVRRATDEIRDGSPLRP